MTPDLYQELKTVVLRIELANAEGNPILSAWLPGAKTLISKIEGVGGMRDETILP